MLAGWLAGWVLAGWLGAGWLAGWVLAGCWLGAGWVLAGCWLGAGWVAGWLGAGWLAGWVAGWVKKGLLELPVRPECEPNVNRM